MSVYPAKAAEKLEGLLEALGRYIPQKGKKADLKHVPKVTALIEKMQPYIGAINDCQRAGRELDDSVIQIKDRAVERIYTAENHYELGCTCKKATNVVRAIGILGAAAALIGRSVYSYPQMIELIGKMSQIGISSLSMPSIPSMPSMPALLFNVADYATPVGIGSIVIGSVAAVALITIGAHMFRNHV